MIPSDALRLFLPEELQQLLWSDLQWDKTMLERVVVSSEGWSPTDPQVGWLHQCLLDWDTHLRRAFVRFVTAAVAMPTPDGECLAVVAQVWGC